MITDLPITTLISLTPYPASHSLAPDPSACSRGNGTTPSKHAKTKKIINGFTFKCKLDPGTH